MIQLSVDSHQYNPLSGLDAFPSKINIVYYLSCLFINYKLNYIRTVMDFQVKLH
jgi:hypothetical protein